MRGDYYILPMNVHEMLIIKKRSPFTQEEIKKLQKKILENTRGKDYLSDQLFQYDWKREGNEAEKFIWGTLKESKVVFYKVVFFSDLKTMTFKKR